MVSIKSILLIEDNSDDAILTMRALEKVEFEFKLDLAKNGSEALEILHNYISDGTALPSLILLDLNLPEVNGIEVLKKIKSDDKTKRIPVVILTSSIDSGDMRQCMDLGANSYIQKPVDFIEFIEVANLIGKYWLSLNETN